MTKNVIFFQSPDSGENTLDAGDEVEAQEKVLKPPKTDSESTEDLVSIAEQGELTKETVSSNSTEKIRGAPESGCTKTMGDNSVLDSEVGQEVQEVNQESASECQKLGQR